MDEECCLFVIVLLFQIDMKKFVTIFHPVQHCFINCNTIAMVCLCTDVILKYKPKNNLRYLLQQHLKDGEKVQKKKLMKCSMVEAITKSSFIVESKVAGVQIPDKLMFILRDSAEQKSRDSFYMNFFYLIRSCGNSCFPNVCSTDFLSIPIMCKTWLQKIETFLGLTFKPLLINVIFKKPPRFCLLMP